MAPLLFFFRSFFTAEDAESAEEFFAVKTGRREGWAGFGLRNACAIAEGRNWGRWCSDGEFGLMFLAWARLRVRQAGPRVLMLGLDLLRHNNSHISTLESSFGDHRIQFHAIPDPQLAES